MPESPTVDTHRATSEHSINPDAALSDATAQHVPSAAVVEDAQLTTTHQSMRIRGWATIYVVAIIVIMGLLVGRVVQLKTHPDARITTAVGLTHSIKREFARRGDLVDREGRVIATSTMGQRLFVDPKLVDDPTTIAVELADMLRTDPVDIDQILANAREGTRYVRVIDLLEDWQVESVRAARLPGVGMEPCLVRHYPNEDVGAGVVGMVGFDHTGLGGIEHMFDDSLEPQNGQLTYLRDVRRRALWIEEGSYQRAAPGQDVRLSIDLVVQSLAEKRLAEAVEHFNAGGGRIVVTDCRSGEILAMADIIREREGWEKRLVDPDRALHPALGRNRCATDPYEPGSTFKPFIWAMATELGRAHPDEVLPCPPSGVWYTPYGRRIRDDHPGPPPVSWQTVLIKSLNSGMAMVADRLSHSEMRSLIHRFGFGQITESGLPGESAGIMTSRDKWSKYTQSSVAFGHEIAVTPLQMIRAFNVFARDGTMTPLRLTGARPTEADFPLVHRVIAEETALLTREALRRVMVEGTGRRCQSSLYQMFGKSGTPQLYKLDGSGYYEDRYMPGFIAGAPFTDPHIVVIAVIDDPDRSIGHYGGTVAGPIVRDVIDGALSYLGVPSDIPVDDTTE